MEYVKEWAVSLCSAAVLCSAVSILSPKKNIEGMIKPVMTCVMLCLLILPLSRIKGCEYEFEPSRIHDNENSSELIRTVEEQSSRMISESIEQMIMDELNCIGVYPKNILVDMDISDDGCISIGQITVMHSADADGSMIERELRSRLGLNVRTQITEEGQ